MSKMIVSKIRSLYQKRIARIVILYIVMLASLIGCDRDYEPIIAAMPISRNIDDLKITISDNIPAHVTVEFLGFLDGCDSYHSTV